MPERELAAEEFIPCPVEEVFAWVADFRHVPEVLDGVDRWEPMGSQERGVGARFRVELSLPVGFSAGATVRLTEWDEPRIIAFQTEDAPVSIEGRWAFAPSVGGTQVGLVLRYQIPRGLGGWVAPIAEILLRKRIEEAVRTMGQVIAK